MHSVPRFYLIVYLATILAFSSLLHAQQSASSQAVVPRLVNFSGKTADAQGKVISGPAGVTFAIYREQSGGAPLWLETQNVQADARGNYTAQLGATQSEGLPLDLFTSGEARWLGVTINGGEEQPRILLLSVPYALKAADAETVGGLPASAFALAAPAVSGHSSSSSTAPSAHPLSAASARASSDVTTTGGTVNAVPLFTTATNVQNSILTQSGTSAINVAGRFNLPPTGGASAAAGKNSHAYTMVASSFSSSTNAAVNQTFQLQAEPAGNDTATPSGTLNLLYGSGSTAPSETGLNISSKGAIKASGLAIGNSAPTEALDLGTNNSMIIRVDPGNNTTEATGGYSLVGRGAGGVPNTWWTYTAPVAGGFGVPANSYSIWQYPPNATPGCCLNRLTILPALASTDTGGTVTIDQGGNIDQALTASGAVKAMATVNGFTPPYQVLSCYNSALTGAAASTPPCGIKFTEDGQGQGYWDFYFGFAISNRFFTVTRGDTGDNAPCISVYPISANTVQVFTSDCNFDGKGADFSIFVY